MSTADLALTPGAPRAVEAGCVCPIMDNAHGQGSGTDENGQPLYWIDERCTLHGSAPRAATGEPRSHE